MELEQEVIGESFTEKLREERETAAIGGEREKDGGVRLVVQGGRRLIQMKSFQWCAGSTRGQFCLFDFAVRCRPQP